ncbi:MAG: glycosyltransferase family 32 protein [Candidatus Babeliales bacterium]
MKNIYFISILLVLITSFYVVAVVQEIYIPESFSQAMISHPDDLKAYNKFLEKTPHKALLNQIVDQYYQFLDKARERYTDEYIIPKIIHQIWIGPRPLPEKTRAWQESWLTMHPDWEYKLWTNDDVEGFVFENKKYFDKAVNWGEKADILRYEILYHFGGVYVDIDFESLKPLDWLNQVCDFYVGIHAVPLLFKNRLRINNGIIAARPGHPILAHAVNSLKHFVNKRGVANRTGPDFFTSIIEDILPLESDSLDMIFPSNFFYPSGPMAASYGFTIQPGKAYVQPETLAVHYYTAFWIKPPKRFKRRRR